MVKKMDDINNSLQNQDQEVYNTICITGVAGTICNALGAEAPECASAGIGILDAAIKQVFAGKGADRVFMYNPDAIGLWLYQKYTSMFEPAILSSQLALPMLSVMPSVTPVAFASMYTGALPEVHGIRAYKKPVLTVDTVFDALIRAGKKPAIISTGEDSISKIFLERKMDYFIYPDVEKANKKAFELIDEDKYDLIVLYNGNYDDNMHKVSPEGADAIRALEHNVNTYNKLYTALKEKWANHNTLLAFAPDHGCHAIDGGSGGHGLYQPEDMNIIHFYTLLPKA